MGFCGGADSKESVCNTGNPGSIPGSGRSCLDNAMDRGAWWATVHGVTESQTQLSN